MELELKGALKKYRRIKAWRSFGLGLAILITIAVPWLLEFNHTDTLICVLGALMLMLVAQLEMRVHVENSTRTIRGVVRPYRANPYG